MAAAHPPGRVGRQLAWHRAPSMRPSGTRICGGRYSGGHRPPASTMHPSGMRRPPATRRSPVRRWPRHAALFAATLRTGLEGHRLGPGGPFEISRGPVAPGSGPPFVPASREGRMMAAAHPPGCVGRQLAWHRAPSMRPSGTRICGGRYSGGPRPPASTMHPSGMRRPPATRRSPVRRWPRHAALFAATLRTGLEGHRLGPGGPFEISRGPVAPGSGPPFVPASRRDV